MALITSVIILPALAGAAPKPNAYEVLGVTAAASDDEITKAFRQAWGDPTVLQILRTPGRWRTRLRALLAYRRLRDGIAREDYDASLDRAAEVAARRQDRRSNVNLADREDELLRQRRERFMPDFATPAQIDALALAIKVLGETQVAWHLEKLREFTSPHQVRALAIAIRATGKDVQHNWDDILRFQNEASVRALEILGAMIGPRLRFKYGTIWTLQSGVQLDALVLLSRVLNKGVEHTLPYVAQVTESAQVEALRLVIESNGPAVEADLRKLLAFTEPTPVLALALAAPVLKANLTFHLHTLVKIKNGTQLRALQIAVARLGPSVGEVLSDLAVFDARADLHTLVDQAERDAASFKNEVRRIARGCRAEFGAKP